MSCQEGKPEQKLNILSLKEFRWKNFICCIASVTCLVAVVIFVLIFGRPKSGGEFS